MRTTALNTAALALLLAGVAPAGAQGDGGDGSGGSDAGGNTGRLTTTPEAKSSDAVGSGGAKVQPPPSAVTGGVAADDACTATETWDAQQMACVEK